MFSSEKHRKISFWDHWNPCCFHFFSAYFFGAITSNPAGIQISLFDWIQISNFKVDFFLLDQLSILWLLFVTGIGSLIHMYSISYMHDDENMHKYFAYLNLFIFFMIT
jgi:NADH-quinone oxidoreductase subunit L